MEQRVIIDDMRSLMSALSAGELLTLARGLRAISAVQAVVSAPVPGAIPDKGEQPTKDAIRTYTMALVVEVSEFLQTLNWKPWKHDKQIDKARVIDEFADILAFLGIIVYYLRIMGISEDDLANGYRLKSITNMRRFLGEDDPIYSQIGGRK